MILMSTHLCEAGGKTSLLYEPAANHCTDTLCKPNAHPALAFRLSLSRALAFIWCFGIFLSLPDAAKSGEKLRLCLGHSALVRPKKGDVVSAVWVSWQAVGGTARSVDTSLWCSLDRCVGRWACRLCELIPPSLRRTNCPDSHDLTSYNCSTDTVRITKQYGLPNVRRDL